MADETTNKTTDGGAPSANKATLGDTTNPVSRGTLIMIAAGILFLIIAGIIIVKFLNSPTGGGTSSQSNSTNTSSRTSP